MKTSTDIHWNERARSVADDVEVNIMDVFQRDLEYDYVCSYLEPSMRLLEVGCGNGFSTQRFRDLVEWVDAFDYAESMVERARERVGERNNRFIHDNVLEPRHLEGPYDAAVCIRVLINLESLAQQRLALQNLHSLLRSGGLLILAEGFVEGFDRLSALRGAVGLPPIEPVAINFYSSVDELLPDICRSYDEVGQFHLGAYDYLTRIVYPHVAGMENVRHNTVFSEQCAALARAFNPSCFQDLSRMRGFVLRKR
jgi:SAM-dependent methyltransferase